MLTKGQEAVYKEILQQIGEASKRKKTLLVIAGPTGVGKRMLLRLLEKEIEPSVTGIVPAVEGLSSFRPTKPVTVSTASLAGGCDIVRTGHFGFEGISAKTVFLKGWTDPEITRYCQTHPEFEALPTETFRRLPELIFGIPLLAEWSLAAHADVETATALAAAYVDEHMNQLVFPHKETTFGRRKAILESYLRAPIPEAVLGRLKRHQERRCPRHLYDHLGSIVQRWSRPCLEEARVLPHFKSLDVLARYNADLKAALLGISKGGSKEILAEIPDFNFGKLYQALQPNHAFHNRLSLFGCADRRLSVLFSGRNRTTTRWQHQPDCCHQMGALIDRFKNHEFAVKPCENSGNYFYLNVESGDDHPLNVLRAGWAVESWLQQAGIAYVARDRTAEGEEIYDYEPNTKQLVC